MKLTVDSRVSTDVDADNEDQNFADAAMELMTALTDQATLHAEVEDIIVAGENLNTIETVLTELKDVPVDVTTKVLTALNVDGTLDSIMTVGFESIEDDHKLEIAAEGIKDTLKKWWEAIKAFFKKIKDFIVNFVKKLFSAKARVQAALNKWVKKLKSSEYVLDTESKAKLQLDPKSKAIEKLTILVNAAIVDSEKLVMPLVKSLSSISPNDIGSISTGTDNLIKTVDELDKSAKKFASGEAHNSKRDYTAKEANMNSIEELSKGINGISALWDRMEAFAKITQNLNTDKILAHLNKIATSSGDDTSDVRKQATVAMKAVREINRAITVPYKFLMLVSKDILASASAFTKKA